VPDACRGDQLVIETLMIAFTMHARNEQRQKVSGLPRHSLMLRDAALNCQFQFSNRTGPQRLSHTGSFGWSSSSGETYWWDETFRIFEYDGATTPNVELIMRERVHPEDVAIVRHGVERAAHDAQDYAHEHRLRMQDGRVKHIKVVAQAMRNATGGVDFVGAVMDITDRKRADEELRRSEVYLAAINIDSVRAF
jgi:hypothetical protein